MKKILSSLAILTASSALFAQSNEQFSAYGNTWLELDAGANIYTAEIGSFSKSEAGASVDLEANFAIIGGDSNDFLGLDIGTEFAYRNLGISAYGGDIDANAYSISVEVRPYIRVLNTQNLDITLFANPFVAYTQLDVDLKENGHKYSISEGAVCYGIKTGIEISFLNDFYITPAYRYVRAEPVDSAIDIGADVHLAELEIGYRLTESISLHFNYAYAIIGNTPSVLSLYSNKLMVGARIGF